MARYIWIALALFLSCAALSEAWCESECLFEFCDKRTSFPIGRGSDVAFTGAICMKHPVPIGIVNTGQAHIMPLPLRPISLWRPPGLKQSFSPHFFKAYNVIVTVPEMSDKHAKPSKHVNYYKRVIRSGVGHETPQQNQLKFLVGKCWFLPITAVQVLDKHGNVIMNHHTNASYQWLDCVTFGTEMPAPPRPSPPK